MVHQDEALLEGVDAGAPQVADGVALTRAFNDLRDELHGTLVYLLGNSEDARDAAQEVFIKAWRARTQVGEIRNLRAWIFRICFNTAKDLKRSAWHRKARPLQAEQYTLPARDASPCQAAEDQEAVARLRVAIGGLRDEEQAVFLLRQNGGLTYEQIADLRECPVSTVKTQMRSALGKLRQKLAPGQEPSDA